MSSPVVAAADSAQFTTANATPPTRGLKALAVFSGLLGFVLFVLAPLLPINQVQSSFSWPQGDLKSVNAPLISYAPERLEIALPVDAIDELRPDQNLLLSTLPEDSPEPDNRGLTIRSTTGGLTVSGSATILAQLSKQEVDAHRGSLLEITLSGDETTVRLGGEPLPPPEKLGMDERPQLTGIYTELTTTSEAYQKLVDQGLKVDVEINSRFTSSPSPLKLASMLGGLVCAAISLFALYRLDLADGRGILPIPREWKHYTLTDAAVLLALGFWYIFGGNTSDDGFILTMARVSEQADYIANYYRWYGVPESPFGSPYYDLLALMTHVSTASMWMRLPQLVAGVLTWLFVSKSLLPRFGSELAQRRLAGWTAALVFLSFWTAYNNGLRPEPVIALGAVITWVCFERAIATWRLLPAALGVIFAALSLAAGPTGLMAVATLLVSLSSLVKLVATRLPLMGSGSTAFNATAMIAPFLAAGTAILVAVFGDQSLATALESARVRSLVGPSLPWYDEYSRYAVLLLQTVDGSLARRFAVLIVFFSLAVILVTTLRERVLVGVSQALTTRLLLVFAGTLFFMTFTPTKWTHHFGVWAGLGAVAAAVAAVLMANYAQRSRSTRIFLVCAVMAVGAVSLSGINGWWYVSSFGVPWWDKTPQIKGIEFAVVALVATLFVFGFGVITSFLESLRRPEGTSSAEQEEAERTERMLDAVRESTNHEEARAAVERVEADAEQSSRRASRSLAGRVVAAPIALACVGILIISYGSFAKSFAQQYPQYSIGMGNLRELKGETGQLANDAVLETNTNDSFLSPIGDTPLKDALDDGSGSFGFDPNNIPLRLDVTGNKGWTESTGDVLSGPNANIRIQETSSGQPVGTEGGFTFDPGVNGSHAFLPFGLDPKKVPVLGSYHQRDQRPAKVTTEWFALPQQRSEDAPLLVVTAAGSTERLDVNGDKIEGETLLVEYGHEEADGSVTPLGTYNPIDAFRDDLWRNLRVPLADLPEEANAVRIKAEDYSLYPGHWLGITPPRVPQLKSINELIDADTPGLLDWPVALQFPNQRTFDHYAGVTEIPKYRISPDKPGKEQLSGFQDFTGGGAQGTAEAVNVSYEVPGYLWNDWKRDWGSLQRYSLRTNSVGEPPKLAEITYETMSRSGWWKPSRMQSFRE